jgi:hypothetical protein
MVFIPIPIFIESSKDSDFFLDDEPPPRSFLLTGCVFLAFYATLPLTARFFIETLPSFFGSIPEPLHSKVIYQLLAMGGGILGLMVILVALFVSLNATPLHWACFWGGLAVVLIGAAFHPGAAETLMLVQCQEAAKLSQESLPLGCKSLLAR